MAAAVAALGVVREAMVRAVGTKDDVVVVVRRVALASGFKRAAVRAKDAML